MPTAPINCWLASRTATASEALTDVLVTLLSATGAVVGSPLSGAICFGPSGDGGSALWSLSITAAQAANAVARFSSISGDCSGVVDLTEARIALRADGGLTTEQAGQLASIAGKLDGVGTPGGPVIVAQPDGRWTHITVDDLKAAARGEIIDQARTRATGGTDPVAEEIANAVARVRRSVATGNALDADEAKVPRSLKSVTVRMAIFLLMERLRFPLNEDQRETRKADQSDLLRIADKKTLVESPDTAAGSGEMQRFGGVSAVNVPPRLTGRERTSGL